jgi:hypothetical protein
MAALFLVCFGIVEQATWTYHRTSEPESSGGCTEGSAVRTETVSLLRLHVTHQDPFLKLLVQLFPQSLHLNTSDHPVKRASSDVLELELNY